MNEPRGVVAWLLGVVGIIAACSPCVGDPCSWSGTLLGPTGPSTGTTPAVELTIYAAASLQEVLSAIEIAYEAAEPGVTLTLATDSSGTLRMQIEQGAPADLFLSADQRNPDDLVEAGLTDGPAVDFAGNALVIVVPHDNPGQVSSPLDLARPGLKIVGAGDRVPITTYATEAVSKLAALAGYPDDFTNRYAANIVSMEDNVGAVMAKIELGEGDAAIVYRTDAMHASRVTVIELPEAAAVTATYSGVVVEASRQRATAHAFLDWLAGRDGSAILTEFGFLPPP